MPNQPLPPKRLTYALLTLTIALLILASFWVEQGIRKQLQADVVLALESVVEAESHGVRTWYEQQRVLAAALAEHPPLKHLAAGQITPQAQAELLNWFGRVRQQQYLTYALLNRQGEVISASQTAEVGQIHALQRQTQLLSEVFTGQVRITQLLVNGQGGAPHRALAALAPVVSDNSEIKALLVLQLNPAVIFPSLLKAHALGQTGETYLINPQGIMLSHSRFEEQLHDLHLLAPGQSSALNLAVRNPGVNLLQPHGQRPSGQLPLTPMAADLVAGHSGARIQPYPDYRGVPVVGAWRWDKQLGLGIATEVDADEAFAGLHRAEWVLYGFTFFAICLLLGLSQAMAHNHRRLEKVTVALLERESRFHKIFDTAQDATLILEGEVIQECNPAAERLLGRSRDDLLGLSWHDLSPLHQPTGVASTPHSRERLVRALQGETQRFHWRFQTTQGTQFSGDVRLGALQLGQRHYCQAVIRERFQDLEGLS